MCGRYQFTEPQNADLRRILQDVRRRCGDRAQDFRFGDVMPTAAAPVLIANGGKVVADLQTWGIPGWKGGLMMRRNRGRSAVPSNQGTWTFCPLYWRWRS